jgi:hypothetical protein
MALPGACQCSRSRTTGYRALMRFLPLACLTLGRDPAEPAAEFIAIFDKVKLGPDKLSTSGYWKVIRAYL